MSSNGGVASGNGRPAAMSENYLPFRHRISHYRVAKRLADRSLPVNRMIVWILGATGMAVPRRWGTPWLRHLGLVTGGAQLGLCLCSGTVSLRGADTDTSTSISNSTPASNVSGAGSTNSVRAGNTGGKTDQKTDTKGAAKSPAGAGTTGSKPVKLDYPAFRIVADRNIFNADRTRRTSRGGGGDESSRPKPAQVSTLSLVGYLSSPQGQRAFFDGTGGSYRKAVQEGETIGDFKVTAITPSSAMLEQGTRKFSLKIGEQLRKEDAGEWELGSRRSTTTTSSDATTVAGDSAGAGSSKEGDSTESAGADDVLQRLLKKRQLEENK